MHGSFEFREQPTLNTTVFEIQKKMQSIASLLVAHGKVPIELLPNLTDLLSPLLTSFSQEQENKLNKMISRAFEIETWDPVTSNNK